MDSKVVPLLMQNIEIESEAGNDSRLSYDSVKHSKFCICRKVYRKEI